MSMFRINPILNTDSYKASHYLQYPPFTTNISSYIESRGGAYDEVVFFGLQAFLKAYMEGEDTKVTKDDIEYAEEFLTAHGLPFNRPGWERIVNVHGGRLPLSIEAVDEGTVIAPSNVLVQARNIDPDLPWVTSYIETALLRAIWYPTTVATRSRFIKKIIKRYLDETADNADGLMFKLHDFGFRGVSSLESGIIGGMGHLVSFMGTDTLQALEGARYWYNEKMAGFSIPAAEHSTITAWGKANEGKAYANMVDRFGGPGKIYAVVSDSYNIYNAVNKIWGEDLRQTVIDKGGTLVVRPDSGTPWIIVPDILDNLGDKFGFTTNSKGYKLLPPYLRVIQGDGINEKSIEKILHETKIRGWSADNLAFGMGGALLQDLTRDTLSFAMKANALLNTETTGWQDVYKQPVTDSGKASKKGRLALIKHAGVYQTVSESDHDYPNLLIPRYGRYGLENETTFAQVRSLAAL